MGFCVGVEHATFMAHVFDSEEVPSIALHGGSDGDTRESAKAKLQSGAIKFIFVADLPRGSFIQLESQAKAYILRNIPSVRNSEIGLIKKLQDYAASSEKPLVLESFLNHHNLSVYDLYGRQGNRTFRRLLVKAGLAVEFCAENETDFTKRLPSLFHLNSKKLLEFAHDLNFTSPLGVYSEYTTAQIMAAFE